MHHTQLRNYSLLKLYSLEHLEVLSAAFTLYLWSSTQYGLVLDPSFITGIIRDVGQIEN